jgi:hypothetical protein
VVREFSGLDPASLRFFAGAVCQQGKHVLAYQRSNPALEVPAEGPKGSRRGSAYVVIGRGRGDVDLRSLSLPVFDLLHGKGGGSASMIEGRGEDFSKIAEVVALLSDRLHGTE